jgi:hypothetical protein
MGTRGAFGVVADGEEKIGYNQFDSYPDGHGMENLAFVRDMVAGERVEFFRQLAKDARLVDEDAKPTREDKVNLAEFYNGNVSNQSTDDWYCLTRDTHGSIQKQLECGYILNSNDFPIDSLFCEWAYIVDFDNEVFEIYKGFQKEEHSEGRFADRGNGGDYKPVRLVKAYGFNELPTDEQFIEDILGPECAECSYRGCEDHVAEPASV